MFPPRPASHCLRNHSTSASSGIAQITRRGECDQRWIGRSAGDAKKVRLGRHV
jgi:hypothetical protein